MLLDVGGVLQLPDAAVIAAAVAPLGIAVDETVTDAAHYRAAAACADVVDPRTVVDHYAAAYIAALGTPPTLEQDVYDALGAVYEQPDRLWRRVAPGARAGLAALGAAGVRVGIVSNDDGLVAGRLLDAGLVQVGPGPGLPVEVIVDSGAVGVEKPDRAIFAIALEAMAVEPQDVWYVGDIVPLDVVGARAAGLTPILLDPLGLQAPVPVAVVRTLAAVVAVVVAATDAPSSG